MANNAKKELLEWLALKPRTEGWGAVVSYNRNKCNNLLAQDYINKFTSGSYMPPISEPLSTGDANWEHMHDWVTTYPRLSFENSSRTAGGEVRMTMAVVGGSQISIDNAMGHKRAIAIKSLDALDYPELKAEDVALSKTSGTVGQDTGEVVLDLGDPVTAQGMWELTFANTQHERRLGGQFFKKYYREADPKKRVFHLGKIAYTDQQYLKPQSFVLRTITAPGAAIAGASNFGDGAVEMFVRMQGDSEGGMPPRDDWRGLIPDDNPGEFDSAILISNKIVMHDVLAEGVRRFFGVADQIFQDPPETGFTTTLRSSVASKMIGLKFQPGTYSGAGFKIDFWWFDILMGDNFSVSLNADYKVVLLWNKSQLIPPYGRSTIHLEGKPPTYVDIWMGAGLSAAGEFKVNESAGTIKLEQLGQIIPDATISEWNAYYEEVGRERAAINSHIVKEYQDYVSGHFSNYFNVVDEIDVFVLNSLLFAGAELVKMRSVDIPGDLISFGEINGLFTITTQDHLMGHGTTHRFQVSPEFTGKVKWSVRAVPGSNGAFGTINEDSGLYTSPAIGQIDGTFVRAIVTATDTASTFSSSTLVTVVVRDITVNPVVQICNASPDSGPSITRTLSANTLGEGVLEWRVIKGDGTIPLRAGPDGKNTYTAGVKNNDLEGSFTVDEIEVKNLATGKTQTAYIVVNHFPQDLKMVVDMAGSSFPAGKAKLKVTDNRDRPVTAELQVIAGNGSVDSSGMYISNPSSPHRFALVKATRDYDDSWILLTYPLIELPDKPVDNLWDD